jgi:hypothetical protein
VALIALDCPHCGVQNVQFQSVANVRRPQNPNMFTVFFACNACAGGVAATIVKAGNYQEPHQVAGNPLDQPNIYRLTDDFYPAPPTIAAPLHTPDRVARYYLQAVVNERARHADAAGAMCRKAVEAAINAVDATLKGPLVKRIDGLEASRQITPALKDWAHAIRLDGNDAVHGDDFTEEEAAQIISFTELFLMYVFTLPGMLAERKAKREPGAPG